MDGTRKARAAGVAILLALAALPAPAGAQGQGGNRGITVSPSPAAEPPVRIVEWVNQSFTVPDSIGVFETPDASRDPVARLLVNTAVEVLGVLEGQTWLQVRLPDGRMGYVVATAIPGALRPRPASMAPSAAPTPLLPPPAAAPAPALQPVAGPALAHDTATLVIAGQAVPLAHLQGLGGAAAQGLQAFIRESGGTVACQPAEGGYACTLGDGTDIAQAVLVNGAAGLRPGAPEAYRAQAEDARRNRRGLWARVTGTDGTVEEQQATILPISAAPATPPPAFQAARVAEGLAYIAGQPFAWHEGEAAALTFVPVIGWGYWDRRHVWHQAPAAWTAQLDRRNPRGAGLREVDARRMGLPVMPPAPRTPASQGARR